MKSQLNSCVALFVLSGFAFGLRAQEAKPLQPGAMIPGAFRVLMATGDGAGRFHCPVCEYDLRPAVLVFAKDMAAGDALKGFLPKLDALIAQYPKARIGASAIFFNDGGYSKALVAALNANAKAADQGLSKSIVAKDAQLDALKNLAKKENLKSVSLGLSSPEAVQAYVPSNAAITVVFYNRQKVIAAHSGAWSDADGDKILQQVDNLAKEMAKPLPVRR